MKSHGSEVSGLLVLLDPLEDEHHAGGALGVEVLRPVSLRGARGRPPLDVDAIVDAVVRISWLAADLGGRLVDLEVNPLIVARTGAGAVAVDARATVRSLEQ